MPAKAGAFPPCNASSFGPVFATFCLHVFERQKHGLMKYFDIDHPLMRNRKPPVKFSCPCCARRTFKWLLNEGAACSGGSCNVQTRIGTWQCLIICILLPNNVQIPSVYFRLLFSYFHCTKAILCLLPFQSKSSMASGPACTLRFSILSPVSFDSTVPLATAFLEDAL